MKTKNKKIKTFSGKFVDPLAMRVEDIYIVDIAHALSNECRYAGHCPEFFSVAQHSMNVAFTAWKLTGDIETTFAALLHDASEAYLKDMPSPVKWRLRQYVAAEKRLLKVIARTFNIKNVIKGIIKQADAHELQFEQWGLRYVNPNAQDVVHKFLNLYDYLQKLRGQDASPMVRRDVTEILRRFAFSKIPLSS